MAEYIKREEVTTRIKEYALNIYGIDLDDAKQFGGGSRSENYCEGLYEATELIDDIPTADVAPVVHGDWKGYFSHCSVCGEETLSQDNGTLHGAYFLTNYCPNCGAKMDGGTTDEL